MMMLQDDMLRASRRFEASGRPVLQEERRAMDHAARRDEAGTAAPAKRAQAIAASPRPVRQPFALLRLWFARQAAA